MVKGKCLVLSSLFHDDLPWTDVIFATTQRTRFCSPSLPAQCLWCMQNNAYGEGSILFIAETPLSLSRFILASKIRRKKNLE
jgi:hypothetical protein